MNTTTYDCQIYTLWYNLYATLELLPPCGHPSKTIGLWSRQWKSNGRHLSTFAYVVIKDLSMYCGMHSETDSCTEQDEIQLL